MNAYSAQICLKTLHNHSFEYTIYLLVFRRLHFVWFQEIKSFSCFFVISTIFYENEFRFLFLPIELACFTSVCKVKRLHLCLKSSETRILILFEFFLCSQEMRKFSTKDKV